MECVYDKTRLKKTVTFLLACLRLLINGYWRTSQCQSLHFSATTTPEQVLRSVGHISRGNKSEYLQPVRHGDRLELLKAEAK